MIFRTLPLRILYIIHNRSHVILFCFVSFYLYLHRKRTHTLSLSLGLGLISVLYGYLHSTRSGLRPVYCAHVEWSIIIIWKIFFSYFGSNGNHRLIFSAVLKNVHTQTHTHTHYNKYAYAIQICIPLSLYHIINHNMNSGNFIRR